MRRKDKISVLLDELIVEVLLRLHLPVKLLLRLRCVSKLFHRLLSCHGIFAQSYNLQILSINNRDIIRNNFIFSNEFDSIHKIQQHSVEAGKLITKELAGVLGDSDACRFIFSANHSFGLVGCCDGIPCFLQRYNNVVYLCNPALNQSRVVPLPLTPYNKNLCFIPDPQTNDYKVIVIEWEKPPFKTYSLRSSCWTPITRQRPVGAWMCPEWEDKRVVVHNGNPHWISAGEQVDAVVNVLDVTQQTVAQIQLPQDCKRHPDHWSYLNLERYKGCLAVTYACLQVEGLHDFWVMDDDSKCWVKQVISVGLPNNCASICTNPYACWMPDHNCAKLCRQACATTSWTYIINSSDGSAAILTDMEDQNSAQKCNGRKDGHWDSFIVAEYVSSIVSLLPEPHHCS